MGRRRQVAVVGALAVLAGLGITPLLPASAAVTGAIEDRAECTATALPAGDDISSDPVILPFTVNFFGTEYSSLWVNNNGNVTFDGPLTAADPVYLPAFGRPVIAPFLADVDTRVAGSSTVTYGSSADGKTFCVDWVDVAPYGADLAKDPDPNPTGSPTGSPTASPTDTPTGSPTIGLGDAAGTATASPTDAATPAPTGTGAPTAAAAALGSGRNSVQLLITDASGTPGARAGDFDITFNYGEVSWEAGAAQGGVDGVGGSTARVGWTAGLGLFGSWFENESSGIAGAFLDGSPTALVDGSLGSDVPGRYVFPVRQDTPVGGSIAGTIRGGEPPAGLAGAMVQLCSTSGRIACRLVTTGADGAYSFGLLPDSGYTLYVSPPGGTTFRPTEVAVSVVEGIDLTDVDVTLTAPTPLPNGTTITSRGDMDGTPVVYWQENLLLTTNGCPNGSGTYTVNIGGGFPERSGELIEAAPGTYTALIPALYPLHGPARISAVISCPDDTQVVTSFDIYIDPSGLVVDQFGNRIAGATVTLLRSVSAGGPFLPVADGSTVMSPSNRTNPDTSASDGSFGWDVLAGFYRVTAQAAGCVNPAGGATVTSPVMQIPPPVTDLLLQLQCSDPNGDPVAADDSATLVSGIASAVSVKGNDSDPDADPLTVTSVTSPAHGYAWVQAGVVRVRFAAAYSGSDSMTYTIEDGKGGSATVTVQLTAIRSTWTATVTLQDGVEPATTQSWPVKAPVLTKPTATRTKTVVARQPGGFPFTLTVVGREPAASGALKLGGVGTLTTYAVTGRWNAAHRVFTGTYTSGGATGTVTIRLRPPLLPL